MSQQGRTLAGAVRCIASAIGLNEQNRVENRIKTSRRDGSGSLDSALSYAARPRLCRLSLVDWPPIAWVKTDDVTALKTPENNQHASVSHATWVWPTN